MIPIVEIEDLLAFEAQNDPTILFHGTTASYSDIIEKTGWQLDALPYDRSDCIFLRDLTSTLGYSFMRSIYLEVNLNILDNRENSCTYFTHYSRDAIAYARCKGGEVVSNAFTRCDEILSTPEIYEASRQHELERVRLIREKLDTIANADPVVYVVKVESSWIDCLEGYDKIWDSQLKEQGYIDWKDRNLRSAVNIPSTAIIAKTNIMPNKSDAQT